MYLAAHPLIDFFDEMFHPDNERRVRERIERAEVETLHRHRLAGDHSSQASHDKRPQDRDTLQVTNSATHNHTITQGPSQQASARQRERGAHLHDYDSRKA